MRLECTKHAVFCGYFKFCVVPPGRDPGCSGEPCPGGQQSRGCPGWQSCLQTLKARSDESSLEGKWFSLSRVVFYKGLWKNKSTKGVLCHQNFLPFEPFLYLASISSTELILVESSPSSKCLLDLLLGQDPSALALKHDALWFNSLFLNISLPSSLLSSSGVAWPAVIFYSSRHCSVLLLRNPSGELPLSAFPC